MAMKDFDWKKFMVEKGERVALAVAGFIALLLIVLNVKSIFSAGPAKNADALKRKTQTLRDQLASNRPKDSDLPEKSDDLMRSFAFTYINDPSRYQVATLFPASGRVDDKRLQPELYTPVEGKVAVVQAQLWSYILRQNEKTHGLEIKVKDAPTMTGTTPPPMPMGRDPRQQVYQNFRAQAGVRGVGSAFERGARTGGPSLLGEGASREFTDPGAEVKARFVDVEKLNDLNNVTLLHTVRPVRMAEIVASFPYKDEVKEFSKKLKISPRQVLEEESLEEVDITPAEEAAAPQQQRLEAFRFLGVVVERRQVDRQGKVLFPDAGTYKDGSGWEELDASAEYKPLLVLSNLQIQEDDPKLDDVIVDGLVMPRLYSARGADQYPKIEEDLKTIDATLKQLEKDKKEGTFVATQATNFNAAPFDPFKRQIGNRQNTGMGPTATPPPKRQPVIPGGPNRGGRQLGGLERGAGAAQDKLILPDHCLIRVLDVTVKPGESYQYRLRVRMANPNFGRADVVHPQEAEASKPENKELKPNPDKMWLQIPGIVTVPTDLHYYAVDQKAIEKDYKGAYKDATVGRDQTVLQIQKYLDNIAPVPNKNVPVGEWSVAERVVVTRGEIIDRSLRVDVPLLVEEEEKWKLASTPGDKGRESGISVSFDGVKGRPALLVDFDRGKKTYKRAGADSGEVRDDPAEEVLILAPDGKLLAHYAGVDSADKDRQDLLKTWRERIEQVRKDNSDPMNPNQGGIKTDSFGRPIRPGGPGGDSRGPGRG
jgi:hypothetical protein